MLLFAMMKKAATGIIALILFLTSLLWMERKVFDARRLGDA